MKKLNQKIIDFALDNSHLSDDEFRDKLMNAVVKDEKMEFDHENFSLTEALKIPKERHKEILDNFTILCVNRGRKKNSELVETFFTMNHKDLAFIAFELFVRIPQDQLVR